MLVLFIASVLVIVVIRASKTAVTRVRGEGERGWMTRFQRSVEEVEPRAFRDAAGRPFVGSSQTERHGSARPDNKAYTHGDQTP